LMRELAGNDLMNSEGGGPTPCSPVSCSWWGLSSGWASSGAVNLFLFEFRRRFRRSIMIPAEVLSVVSSALID
jgi:hypothetical protein